MARPGPRPEPGALARQQKNPEFLLPRSLLDPALRWLSDYPDELAGPPADYIQASKRRRTRRRGLLTGTVAVLVVASLAAAGIFYSLRQTAVSQSHLAQSEEMAAEAMNLFSANVPLAMLLSVQAYERARTPQARSALIEAAGQPLGDLLAEGGTVDSVAFSPNGQRSQPATSAGMSACGTRQREADRHLGRGQRGLQRGVQPGTGRLLAAGDDGGYVGLWDTASGRRTATLAGAAPSSAWRSARNGQMLAVGDAGGHVGLWDTASGQRTATLAEGSAVNSVAFSPERSDARGRGRRRRMSACGTPAAAGGPPPWPRAARSTAWRSARNGQTLAAGDAGGHVGLWDTGSGRRTATLAEGSPVNSVAFSPDGHTLAVGDGGGDVSLWDTVSGRRTATLAEGGPVNSVAFSPDGQTLAAGDYGGDVGLWDTGSGQRTAALAEGSPVYSVAFSPDGQTLAVGDFGGDVGLWDTGSGTADRHPGRGQPCQQRGVQPGRPDARGRRQRRTRRPVEYRQRPADRHPGRGQPRLQRGVQPGRPHARGRRLAAGMSACGTPSAAGGPPPWPKAAMSIAWRSARTATRSRPATTAAMSACGTPAAGRRTATLAEGSPVSAWRSARTADTLAVGDTRGNVGLWDTGSGKRTATLAEGSPVY